MNQGWPIIAFCWQLWGLRSSKLCRAVIGLVFRGGPIELEQMGSADPPLAVHAFTVAVIINIVAVVQGKYTNRLGLLAVAPLALLSLSGLYLFVLPYANKWRSGRRTG